MSDVVDDMPIPSEDRFPSLSDMLEDFLEPHLVQQVDPVNTDQYMAFYIESLKLDVPIEIQAMRDEQHHFMMGTSPPTQWIETSVQPVLHQLRLTLELDDGESGNQTLES